MLLYKIRLRASTDFFLHSSDEFISIIKHRFVFVDFSRPLCCFRSGYNSFFIMNSVLLLALLLSFGFSSSMGGRNSVMLIGRIVVWMPITMIDLIVTLHIITCIWSRIGVYKSQPFKFPASSFWILLSIFFWLLLIRNLGVLSKRVRIHVVAQQELQLLGR